MVLDIIHADILLIARIFPHPFRAGKNTPQLAKYSRVLYVKPLNKMYVLRGRPAYKISKKMIEQVRETRMNR